MNKLEKNTGSENKENPNIDSDKRAFLELSAVVSACLLSSVVNWFWDDIWNVVNPDLEGETDGQKKELEVTDSFWKWIEKYFDINEWDLEKFLNWEVWLTAKDTMNSETLLSLMPEKVWSLKIEWTTWYRWVFRKCDGVVNWVKRKGFYLIGQRWTTKKYWIKKWAKISFFQDNKSVESEDKLLKPRKQISKEFYPRSYEELTNKELYSIILEKNNEWEYIFLSGNLRPYDALSIPRFILEFMAEITEHILIPYKWDLKISSARRPCDENWSLSSSVSNSRHLLWLAIDFYSYNSNADILYSYVKKYVDSMNYKEYFWIENFIEHADSPWDPKHLHVEFYPRITDTWEIWDSVKDKIVKKNDKEFYDLVLKKYKDFFWKKYHFDKFYKKHFINWDVSKLWDFIEDVRMKKDTLFWYSLERHYQYLIDKYEWLEDYLSMSDLRVVSELDGIDTDNKFLSVVALSNNRS